MRIEDVNENKLPKACDKELLILKLRFTQAWDRNVKNKSPIVISDLTQGVFLTKYKMLLHEMNTRSIERSTSAIDKATFKKTMVIHKYGIDVSDLKEIVLSENHIYIPAANCNTEELDKIIKAASLGFVDYTDQDEPESAYIPLYDLVLKAKSETEIIKVSDKLAKKVSKKLLSKTSKSYIDKLPDSAFLYVSTSIKQSTKSLIEKEHSESSLEDFEYLLHHIVVDEDGNEIIHHCFLYDHIANMFEQEHLVIKDGIATVDNKKVTNGAFHILKGLEQSQDIAWSDKDASENNIKAKKMKAGMNFKEKSKVW